MSPHIIGIAPLLGGRRRRRRRQRGNGFFEDLGNGFVQGFTAIPRAINKVVPGGFSAGLGLVNPVAGVAAKLAGFGKRRRMPKKRMMTTISI